MTDEQKLAAIDEAIEYISTELHLGEVWLHEFRQHALAGQNLTTELREFFTVLKIARVTHAANKAWCEEHGDYSQTDWEDAPQWQKNSALIGVIYKLQNPDATSSQQHEEWIKIKIAEGWTFGSVKDTDAKTHPCLLPYDQLPPEQRKKDELFGAIVNALSSLGGRDVVA
jgi:hypothetical protein